jgi:hypothetical protein
MSTVNKKLLTGVLASMSLYAINVSAENLVSCNTINGAIENTAITASTAHLTDNIDGTISDPKTGLIWKKCSEGQVWFSRILAASNGCIDEDLTDPGTYTWQAALQRAQDVNTGSGQNFSQTDWRLPNIKELLSILELRCNNTAINNTVFPFTPAATYWSSSPVIYSPAQVWRVGFNDSTFFESVKSVAHNVRLVRNGQ